MSRLPEFAADFHLLWLISTGGLGGIIGSFLNVVIHRLPVILERRWRREALMLLAHSEPEFEPVFNLMIPRSHCPYCFQPLSIRDNIPLLSYLFLKGKSRCCGERIPIYYPLVEITSSVLFILAASRFHPGLTLVAAWLFIAMLLVLAVIDCRTAMLPDVLTLSLLWLGLLFSLQGGRVPLEEAVVGAVSGYLCLWGLYWLFRFVTGREGLGYGDFKLAAALGAWMGWQVLPSVLLFASVSGLIITVLLRFVTATDFTRPLPFGPWLALSGVCHFLLM
ncbi:prepilin peptidase [Escherichia coli]